MLPLPGRRMPSPGLQKPGGVFFSYVNDICSELCDAFQQNVDRVYQEFSYTPLHKKKHSAAASYELQCLKRKKCKWLQNFFLSLGVKRVTGWLFPI